MFKDYNDILTINDLQDALGIGRTMAYSLMNDESIKHLRIGKTIKIPKPYLIDYILNSCYTEPVAADNLAC